MPALLLFAGCTSSGDPHPTSATTGGGSDDPFDGLDIELAEVDGPEGRVVRIGAKIGKGREANVKVRHLPGGSEPFWGHCRSDAKGLCTVDVPADYFVLEVEPGERPPLGPHVFELSIHRERGLPSAEQDIEFDRPPTCWTSGTKSSCTGLRITPRLRHGVLGLHVESGDAGRIQIAGHVEQLGEQGDATIELDASELPLGPARVAESGRAFYEFEVESLPRQGVATTFDLRLPARQVLDELGRGFGPGETGIASSELPSGGSTLLWWRRTEAGPEFGGVMGDGETIAAAHRAAVLDVGESHLITCGTGSARAPLALHEGTIEIFDRRSGERLTLEKVVPDKGDCPDTIDPTLLDVRARLRRALVGGAVAEPGLKPRLDCASGGKLAGVAYGEDPAQRLDIQVPEGEGPRPLVVYVHGGGWRRGGRDEVHGMPEMFADAGIAFASVDYRLSPPLSDTPAPGRLRHPNHVRDVARALAWLHGHAEDLCVDPAAITVMGHSAGAHLATLVSVDPSHMRAAGASVADLRCAISLDSEGYDIPRELAETTDEEQRRKYINAFGDEVATQEDGSPLHHVEDAAEIPRFLVVHRETMGQGMGHEFLEALADAGFEAEGYLADHLTHAGLKTELGKDEALTGRVLEFLEGCAK